MPKKMNRVELQNYVPAGESNGGEYTYNSGSGGGSGSGNKFSKKETTENKNNSEIVVSSGNEKHKNFADYINKNHNNEFGKTLTENFDTGNDEAKSVIDNLIQKGTKIESTNGSSYYDGGVVLGGISKFGEYSAKVKGETFYHEFWHAADNMYSENLLSEQDKNKLASKYGLTAIYYMYNISTSKNLSNGKTLYDTINEECHKISMDKANGKWQKIIDDYNNDVNSFIGNFDLENNRKIINKYEEEARKKFPIYDDTGKFMNNAYNERKNYLKQFDDYNKAKKEFDDYNLSKSKARAKALRHWGSISDIYGLYKKTGYGFADCGHAASYAKSKGAIAKEFMAEYGSARSRTDEDAKKELGLFKKYFPEASKCAEEIYNLVVKGAK